MKSLYFNEKGIAENVIDLSNEIELKNPEKSEVTVKVIASTINPADLMFIENIYRIKPEFPQIAGFEAVGKIENSNNNIEFQKNELVAFRHKNSWAEFVNVPTDKIIKLPANFPLEKAAQVSLNPLTAWALIEESKAKKGDWILLTAGNSSVSQLIIQIAKTKEINTVSLVRDNSQNAILKKIGVTEIVNTNNENLENEISQLTKHENYSCLLDAVGGNLVSKVIKHLPINSKIIHYGLLSNENISYHNSDIIFKNLTIEGFGIDKWINQKQKEEIDKIWNEILLIVSNDRFYLPISGKYELNDFRNAILNSKNNREGKTLFWLK